MAAEEYLFGRRLARVNANANGGCVGIEAMSFPDKSFKFSEMNQFKQGYFAATFHFLLNCSHDHESLRKQVLEIVGEENLNWLNDHRMLKNGNG